MSRLISVTTLLLVLATPAAAQGVYLDLFAGTGETDDTNFAVLGTSRIDTAFDNTFTYGIAVGYDFGNSWRLEGELTRREADVDTHQLDGGAPIDGSFGEGNSVSLFANVFYDFETGSSVTPYVGLGVGQIGVDYANFGVPGLDALDDDDGVLGYQFVAGLAVGMSENWDFRADLRLVEAEDASLTSSAATNSTASDVSYSAYDLTVGVRYRF